MATVYRRTGYVKDPKTGERVRRKYGRWIGQYVDADGVERRVPLSRDKAAAQQMLAELVRGVERERAGLTDPFEGHRRRPLSAHVDDFEAHLRDKGCGAEHVGTVCARLRKVIAGCGFRRIGDVSPSAVQSFVAGLGRRGLGVQTRNFYLQAVKQFCRWMVRDGRTDRNAVEHLQGGNVRLDRRRDRRAIAHDEMAALIRAAQDGPVRHGVAGPDRAVLYLVAYYTGLRASELASLAPSGFDLDSDPPKVKVRAGYSKRRREDVLPLPRDLAERLRPWIAGKIRVSGPTGPLWPGTWAKNRRGAAMVRGDLAVAGIPFETPEGRADFHALRHSFISNLVRAGVSPKVAQQLARHSTIALTMDRYAHTEMGDLSAGVESLPPVPGSGKPKEREDDDRDGRAAG